MMKLPLLEPIRSPRPAGRTMRPSSDTDRARLVPVDTAAAQPRPDTIADTYLELQYDALATEQIHLFAAAGQAAMRRFSATAKSDDYAQRDAREFAERDKAGVEKARLRYEQTRDLLTPYVHRKSTSSVGYMARMCGLLVGDVAGLSGAAIMLGEYPSLAIVQAISAGTATITAGLAGAEIKHRQHAAERRQEIESLPKALEPYRQLFECGERGRSIVMAMTGAAAGVALSVSTGVFALRTSVEGTLAGVTFGALAAAIATASFINSWHHADLVADAVDSEHRQFRCAARRHRRCAGARVIKRAERAAENERSILAEYDRRGKAAASRIESLKYRALLESPDVVGHGPATSQVGRKPRRGEPS